MANNFQRARTPHPQDRSVINTSGSDIGPWLCVKLDTSNPVSGTQSQPGVVLTGSGDYPYGVTVETIPAGKSGRVASPSSQEPVTAESSFSVGAILMCGFQGRVKTQTSAEDQVGQAVEAASVIDDVVLAALAFAKNS